MGPPYDFAPGPPFARSITGLVKILGCLLFNLRLLVWQVQTPWPMILHAYKKNE